MFDYHVDIYQVTHCSHIESFEINYIKNILKFIFIKHINKSCIACSFCIKFIYRVDIVYIEKYVTRIVYEKLCMHVCEMTCENVTRMEGSCMVVCNTCQIIKIETWNFFYVSVTFYYMFILNYLSVYTSSLFQKDDVSSQGECGF